MNTTKDKSQRQYPPIYEKLVPIALKILFLIILLLLGVTIAVALGFYPRFG